MHRFVHEEELARSAALSGAQEGRRHRGLHRLIDVRVVEHDQWPVPAHLEEERLAGRPLRDLVAGLRRADESDRVGARARDDLVSDDAARPGDQVEHSHGQLGIDDALGQLDRAD